MSISAELTSYLWATFFSCLLYRTSMCTSVHHHSGHQLWRSINAIVLLKEQMRQSDDQDFAAALGRIGLHEPTPQDIEMLNRRNIGGKKQ